MSNPQALEFKKLGNAAFSKGDHEEAIKQFTLAIEQDASDHVFFRYILLLMRAASWFC